MSITEFEEILGRVARRLRLRGAAAAALLPAGVLLGSGLLAIVGLKLWAPAGAAALAPAAAALAAAAALTVCGALYAARPVSDLCAAAEVDRLAGLKERAASLVAVRAGAGGATPARLRAELKNDVARALAPLRAGELLGRVAPLPAGARWLGVLLAAALCALLVPARARARQGSLADLLAGGDGLVFDLEATAAGDDASPDPAAKESAKKALAIIRAAPPADAEEARQRRAALEKTARELRGRADLAARLRDAARALAAQAGLDLVAPLPGRGPERRRVPDGGRYPPEYAELLARYFSSEGG